MKTSFIMQFSFAKGTTEDEARVSRVRTDSNSLGSCAFVAAIVLLVSGLNDSVALAQSCAALPTGIVSWWPADGNAKDIVGPNNGTLQNGAGFAQGVVGQAFSLNYSNSAFVLAPNAPSLNVGTEDFSMEAWIKSYVTGSVATIMDKRVCSALTTCTGYHWYIGFEGFLAIQLDGSDGVVYTGVAEKFIQDGNFHHVAVTVHRGSTTGGKLFIDGVSAETFDLTPVHGSLDNAADFLIGGHEFWPEYTFGGLIDEFSLYKRALSDEDILAIYKAGSAGKCKPSVAAPTATAISLDPTAVRLTWNDTASGKKGFRIQSKEGQCSATTPWAIRADVGANTRTFLDTLLQPSSPYSYRVSTYYGGGSFSQYSRCTSATTGAPGTPHIPTVVTAVSRSNLRIDLSWRDFSANETAFNIYRRVGTDGWALLDTVMEGTEHYSDLTAAGNSATTTYVYDVRACNNAGCSMPNRPAIVPFRPTNLAAMVGATIRLTWRDRSSNESGFKLERKNGVCTSATPWVSLRELPPNAQAYTDNNVVPGTTYSYRVRAAYNSAAMPTVSGLSRYTGCVTAIAP